MNNYIHIPLYSPKEHYTCSKHLLIPHPSISTKENVYSFNATDSGWLQPYLELQFRLYIYIILGQACKFPYPLVSNLWPAPSGLFSPLKFPSCNSHSLLGQVLHRLMHCDLDATFAPGMWWGCGWDLQLRPEHRSGVPSWLSEL